LRDSKLAEGSLRLSTDPKKNKPRVGYEPRSAHGRAVKKQHIYERKLHETKLADFIPKGVRETRTQALENVSLSGPLSTHPRIPRGYWSGRCDIFGRATFLARNFISRAEINFCARNVARPKISHRPD